LPKEELTMTRGGKILCVTLVALLGLWGCAKGPAGNAANQAERLRALEGKCARLEDDYRAVAGARDQARKRIVVLEEDTARLQKELTAYHAVLKERDSLRQQVDTRTGERDALQLRCDRLKKGLQNLLGQDDAALSQPPAPASASTATLPTES
jgi:hypothetical protein